MNLVISEEPVRFAIWADQFEEYIRGTEGGGVLTHFTLYTQLEF